MNKLIKSLKKIVADEKTKWTANHPPVPGVEIYEAEKNGESLAVMSLSGKDGTWSYRIVTDGPDSPPEVDGFRTKEDAMKAAEEAV